MSIDGRRSTLSCGSQVIPVRVQRDCPVQIWDFHTGLPVTTFHGDGAVNCCAVEPRGSIVVGDGRDRVYVLALEE
jgi:hypothetical protein